jgi:two-component system chemotaxis response regulator CheY
MSKKILIAEDNTVVLALLQQLLKKEYELILAYNGKEAFLCYKKNKPDLVIMDLFMPETDGMKAIHQIKKSYPYAKIIVLSAHETDKLKKEALNAGVLDYINKPFSVEKLSNSIKNALSMENKQL